MGIAFLCYNIFISPNCEVKLKEEVYRGLFLLLILEGNSNETKNMLCALVNKTHAN